MAEYIFSIIIPTLNEERYLPNLLNDLDNQQTRNFEVIIVDGKSEDQTREEALQFARKFPFKFIQSPKRNLSYQRNLGAKNSNGKYFFFFDAYSSISSNLTQKFESYV